MISVCIATRNGSRYVGEQLRSILGQLDAHDEVIVSDDASTDATIEIVKSFNDSQIKILRREHSIGIVANFEASLRASKVWLIFLADQDDAWLPGNEATLINCLSTANQVVSDSKLADHTLALLDLYVTKKDKQKKGLLRNLIRNSYTGCCMAFRRDVLNKAHPFPKDISMHDLWIGRVAEMYFTGNTIPDQLLLHRRHQRNATATGHPSQLISRLAFCSFSPQSALPKMYWNCRKALSSLPFLFPYLQFQKLRKW